MTTNTLPDRTDAPRPSSALPVRHFVRHYVEMLVAMVVGMVVLDRLEGLVLPDLMSRADVGALVMATNMAVGMGAWMRFRGHSRRGIAEMAAAMYLPFLVLLVPWWAGAVAGDAVMLWGHVLMLLSMAMAMVLHPAEYAH